MKPYGTPREVWADPKYADVDDIQHYGMKSSVGRTHGSLQAQHPFIRKAKNRNFVRRIWKKKLRAANRKELIRLLEETQ